MTQPPDDYEFTCGPIAPISGDTIDRMAEDRSGDAQENGREQWMRYVRENVFDNVYFWSTPSRPNLQRPPKPAEAATERLAQAEARRRRMRLARYGRGRARSG